MNSVAYTMANSLEAVDPMVLTLKAAVIGELDKTAVQRFEICVIEALTNAVKHGWVGKQREEIELSLHLKPNDAVVDILDPIDAPAFDLRDHATDLDNIDIFSENGRGLGLILQCADYVDYHEIDGRNRLTLGFSNEATK